MNEVKPIKRSPELRPLSREHHDGLLFVWKIREGLRKGTSIEKVVDFVGWYWKNHIRPHFYQEEKILAPLIVDNPLIERMKEEHNQIRELLIDMHKDSVPEDLLRFAGILESHIRFEERELFQYLEEHLSPNDLATIHEQLEKHPVHIGNQPSNSWKDEFWLRVPS